MTPWGGALHQTFRLLPSDKQTPSLRPFLEADGLTPVELLERLPYHHQRASEPGAGPDLKRYRDGRQVFQTVGLLYERLGRVALTELGHATRRWLPLINASNRLLLVRHAAYALAACQLRNPTAAGRKYPEEVHVFPFAFIWRAMLSLDGRISSEELNRGLFKVQNEGELSSMLDLVRRSREVDDVTILGARTLEGDNRNDRIIPWMSLASFGWAIFPDKRGGQDGSVYELDPKTIPLVREASRVRHKHRAFASVDEYVAYIARCAALPKDLR